jgi:hypothetical protein
MARIQHNAKLNQLVVDLGRSLLQFVGEVSPWTPANAVATREAVARLVRRQQADVARLTDLLVARSCPIDFGMYPSDFTDLHFLSLKSLLPRVIASQEALIAELDEAAHTCIDDPEAVTVLGEVLSSERAGTEELKTLKA